MTWKFRQIKPMKARGKLEDSMWDDINYIAEIKYDGDRRIAQFMSPFIRFTGTRESVDGSGFVEKTANLPQLHIAGKPCKLEGTVLDGEIIAPIGKEIKGGRSKYVTSIMGSLPTEALRKQRAGGFLCYAVFDCLWFKGLDLRASPFITRRNYAEQAVRAWGNSYVAMATQAVGVGKRAFYDLVIRDGGEGVVLKHVSSRVGDQRDWVKVKAEATADVIVEDFKPGKGKNTGKVGAIYIAQYRPMSQTRSGTTAKLDLWRCGSVRGFDDATMRSLTVHPKAYIGRVLRIKHNGREPTGKFRHPRFDSWRDDKSPKDCVYDQDES